MIECLHISTQVHPRQKRTETTRSAAWPGSWTATAPNETAQTFARPHLARAEQGPRPPRQPNWQNSLHDPLVGTHKGGTHSSKNRRTCKGRSQQQAYSIARARPPSKYANPSTHYMIGAPKQSTVCTRGRGQTPRPPPLPMSATITVGQGNTRPCPSPTPTPCCLETKTVAQPPASPACR